ncbi:pseudouridine synthase [Arthrobacter sp. USHLN218]|uniref:pseudouridine synthase n=1 Tax=Arthrobacter sp. USHLN218 TaxID=3081232 RepID=UPI003019B27A
MTQAPRSGSGRNTPRGGGKGPKPGGKPARQPGAAGGQGRGGKPAPGADRGGKPAFGSERGGKPAPGQRRDAAGRPGSAAGSGKADQGKAGQGKARPGKPSTGRKPGAKAQPAGPRPFGRERFGQNLGPVRNRPRPQRAEGGQAGGSTEGLHDPNGVRLQKVLAQAGVASRRVCEDMIAAGRVEVDGAVVTELGVRVDPATAVIHVDGIRIQTDETLVYYVFNKPKGVVSTMEDPEGRPCISDFLKKNKDQRLFHVGRLDQATEGLLLLTNDGELANRLTHPSYEVPKTYLVQVRGPMAQGVGAQMKDGIELEDGVSRVDSFRLVDSTPGHVLVEVVLHSGKNRIVRRMFDAVGHPVERLVRTQVGPIRLGDQRQGSIRALGRTESGHLLALVGM